MSMRTVFTGKRLAEMIDHAVRAAIVTAGAIGIGRGIAGEGATELARRSCWPISTARR